MALKLMYITRDPVIAKIAEDAGVDWIFVDLEWKGKHERQGHLDTVISGHKLEDIIEVKRVLTDSKLLVRVNPIHQNSGEEIKHAIENGADIIMLPYFKSKKEVERFLNIVNGKAQTCLLVETAEAVDELDKILQLSGIDCVHIGLNDLHLAYKKRFMFELLVDGTVEKIGSKVKHKGIPFGFGGIARLGEGKIPAELIISEHYRLGSQMAILSRSFCDATRQTDVEIVKEVFQVELRRIREFEESISFEDSKYFADNQAQIANRIKGVIEKSEESSIREIEKDRNRIVGSK